MKEEKIFLEYFNEEKNVSPEIIKNSKNKRIIFRKEVETKKYYIKKYILEGRKAIPVVLGLRRDKAKHYEFISKKMKKIGIKHIEPYYIKVKRKSFFSIHSILVTKARGEKTLEDYIKDFKLYKDWFRYYFDVFVLLCKNGIYSTDYNLSGMLVNEKNELLLLDFDSYKIKLF